MNTPVDAVQTRLLYNTDRLEFRQYCVCYDWGNSITFSNVSALMGLFYWETDTLVLFVLIRLRVVRYHDIVHRFCFKSNLSEGLE